MISIVLPVYNEEQVLEKNVKALLKFLDANFNDTEYKIIIADNASVDRTSIIGKQLSFQSKKIIYNNFNEKGKGLAVISSWQKYPADTNIFMDIDFSADLAALKNLICEDYDIVIGSRKHTHSIVKRSFSRKFISVCLNFLLKSVFKTKIKDTACGFKSVNKKILDNLLPQIKNQTWFFDTEMLLLAEKGNFKIKEIPIVWKENDDSARKSTVKMPSTIFDYLKEIYVLKKRLRYY